MKEKYKYAAAALVLLFACVTIPYKRRRIRKGVEMAGKRESIEQVKSKYEMEWLRIEGVEGVGIGEENEKPVIRVYVAKKTKTIQEKVPSQIEGYPVRIEVSGEFHALPR